MTELVKLGLVAFWPIVFLLYCLWNFHRASGQPRRRVTRWDI